MKTSPLYHPLLTFTVGLVGGLLGQSLLFMESQARKIEQTLVDDFKVVAFVKADLNAGKLKVLEEKVRALPDVESARLVSRDEALDELKRVDPDLVESVALLGENPLQPAFEVRLAAVSLARAGPWVENAYALTELEDIRYKPAQIRAILLAQFYGHFLKLVANVSLCFTIFMLAGFFGTGFSFSAAALKRAAAFPAGTLTGMGLTYVLVYPVRNLYSWWTWPSLPNQTLLVLAAVVLGFCFSQDK